MLKRLAIKNYKSLENVALELRPLNVLVGPNNAGKSNLMDSLEWLHEFMVIPGTGAIESRGGFKNLVWNGEIQRTISIELSGSLDHGPSYQYLLEVSGGKTHHTVSRELFKIDDALLLEYPSSLRDYSGGYVVYNRKQERMGSGSHQGNEPNLKYLGRMESHPELSQLKTEIEKWTFHNPVPSMMKDPVQIKRELRLGKEGENLSGVLHSIHSEFRDSFQKLEAKLRTAVPEVSQLVTALTEAGETYINLKENKVNLSIPSWAMSDGTLALLAMLAVFYSPAPPSLACLEEPENFLHPHLLELLGGLLINASGRSQIMITTHSPFLLDQFKPENVIVVEKKEGKTTLKPALDKKGIKKALRDLGLGEFWYSGALGGVPE